MMHNNSTEAYEAITKDGSKLTRFQAVLQVFESGKSYTDRQVLWILFPGSDNINKVQPRISEAIDKGLLEECGFTRDHSTGKNVRLVRLRNREAQIRMF